MEAINNANQFINNNKNRVGKRWYPAYHVAAPIGWINDPNGFCVYKGEYHLFYQYYPYAPEWGPMHWGHVKSGDLIHWTHLPVALAPTESYEKNGCFSGSAIEKDGKLYLLYTGHVGLFTDADKSYHCESQALAVSDDGITFTKYAGNPVITVPQLDGVTQKNFRDPKVWKHNDKYYCVIGSTENRTRGMLLLFESDDLEQWQFKNVMARGEGNMGTMWECPNFAEIDGHEAIIFSPQDVKPEGNKYLNVHQSVYMLGKTDYDAGVFEYQPFEMLDYGFDFYAPQVTQTSDGRCIMIAWLNTWWSEMPEKADHWCGMMTVPRELHIREGRVISQPARELQNLRKSETAYTDLKLDKATQLEGICGDVGEFEIAVDVTQSDSFALKFRVSNTEETVLSYDKATGIVTLNRDRSGVGKVGTREVVIPMRDTLKIRAYLDKSSLEFFINEGEYVMSTRVYPADNADGIVIVPDAVLTVKRVAFYKFS